MNLRPHWLPALFLRTLPLLLAALLGACQAAAEGGALSVTAPAEELRRHALTTGRRNGADPRACGLPPPPAPPAQTMAVQVFFSCFAPGAAPGQREQVVPRRQIVVPPGEDPKRVALRALFAGPTEAERAAGLLSFYGAHTRDIAFEVSVVDGDLAVVNFAPGTEKIILGNLHIFVTNDDAWQIVETLGQSPEVRQVAILIGGEHLCKVQELC